MHTPEEDNELRYHESPYEERFKKGSRNAAEFDKTQLHFKHFQFQPHKDYLGHIFRWGFVGRYVNRKTTMLDVGCGQDLPLLRSLGGSNPNAVPTLYVGCDMNPIPNLVNRKYAKILPECNFIEKAEEINLMYGPFNLLTNFEVYEHVAPEYALPLLRAMRSSLALGGCSFQLRCTAAASNKRGTTSTKELNLK